MIEFSIGDVRYDGPALKGRQLRQVKRDLAALVGSAGLSGNPDDVLPGIARALATEAAEGLVWRLLHGFNRTGSDGEVVTLYANKPETQDAIDDPFEPDAAAVEVLKASGFFDTSRGGLAHLLGEAGNLLSPTAKADS